MPSEPSSPSAVQVCSSGAGRVLALCEVCAVFACAHVSWRACKYFTAPGRAEVAAGLNFSAGTVMVLFTLLLALVHGGRFADYGLGVRRWPFLVNVGLIWGVVPVSVAAVLVAVTDLAVNPRQAPSPEVALISVAGSVLFTALMLWMLRRDRPVLERAPPIISVSLLALVLCVPPGIALLTSHPQHRTLWSMLWTFFGAGFGEEFFFRGYIQSRINAAFGRPLCLLGATFGPGLLVSALLFGLVHVLNTVDYFGGRYEFSWWWGVANVGAGLFFGMLRERTGSVWPGAVAHGVDGVLKLVPQV